jgi:sigma-B regulation protein RsbU (phosphoserine phosphatase)
MAVQILIVDDEPDVELLIRQRFRRELREGIYQFHFARHGEEALVVIRANPSIEIVLTDINMPVMDGLTLLGRLHELETPPGTVIVSAYGDMANIRAAMNRGAFDFLTKPIDFHDFEVTVRKTLEQVRQLREAAADRDRLLALERDLHTAAQIQRSFLPPAVPPEPWPAACAIHAAMLPAREVGGDFFDYFLVETDGPARLGLVIGDVAGKGMPAALFMAVSRTLLRAAALRGAAPGECLGEVNRLLRRDSNAPLFVTLFYASLEPQSGELLAANGGHLPPFLLRAGRVEPLPCRGLPVGSFPDATYETGSVQLEPDDRLLLYTDGVTEALDPLGDQFGRERLREVLRQGAQDGPERLVAEVFAAVQRFAAGAPQADDLTALALRYDGPGRWRRS